MSINPDDLTRLAELNAKIKILENEMEPIKSRVKDVMVKEKLTSVSGAGHVFSLSSTVRTTCKEKDKFVAFLASKGLKSCINIVTEPNFDRALDEIKAGGDLTQAEFDQFVKQTPVHTFRIK